MANVTIHFSQATLDTLMTLRADSDPTNLGVSVDVMFLAEHAFMAKHANYTSMVTGDGTLSFDYGAAGSKVLSGFSTGFAGTYATKVEETNTDAFRLTYTGKLNFPAGTYPQAGPTIADTGGTLSDLSIATLLPKSSASYDALFGNATSSLHGALQINAGDIFSGTLTSIEGTAEHFELANVTTGSFKIGGDGAAIGLGQGSTTLSGVVSGYTDTYDDGSAIVITNAAIAVTGATVIDERLLANGANLAGNDVIDISLPATLQSPWLISAGTGDDTIKLAGGGGGLSLNAGSGNDRITLVDRGHAVDGGSGLDTAVVVGKHAAFTVAASGSSFAVTAAGGTLADTLTNVERLQFDDAYVALDLNGSAGQAYRIYQAAFDRKPDLGGLGFWIGSMDKGMSLNDASAGFMASPEFIALYGANPSDLDFVSRLYHNVLHRDGEKAGIDFWVSSLSVSHIPRNEVLAQFSASPENQAQVIGSIQNGIEYIPYVV